MYLTPPEKKELAKEIAAQVFLHIGIDVEDKAQVARLRDNLSLLNRIGRGAEVMKSTAIRSCVGAFFVALFTLLVLGLKDWAAAALNIVRPH